MTITTSNSNIRKFINKFTTALNKSKYLNKGGFGTLRYYGDHHNYIFSKNSERTYQYFDYEFTGDRNYLKVNIDRKELTIETNLSSEELEDLGNTEWYKDTLKNIKLASQESLKLIPDSKKIRINVEPTISRNT